MVEVYGMELDSANCPLYGTGYGLDFLLRYGPEIYFCARVIL